MNQIYYFLKRVIDIVVSIIAIIIFSPIMVITAIAIKITSPGPILADTPPRVSKNGKLFRIYKFRSMVTGGHELLKKDPALYALYQKNSYKLPSDIDPRVTKVGRFIRITTIDELPQFFNALRGEMSVVGPRAYYPFELEEQQQKYPKSREFVKIILQDKPGITGVWQVSGRSNINFDKRVEMDAHYVQRKSIFYDLYLILMTVPAVLSRKGAI